MHFASDAGQARNEAWDRESNLLGCGSGAQLVKAYQDEGYLDSPNLELMQPLASRAVIFVGRQSNVIGADTIDAAAAAWQVPVRWFEHSGHFPYVEEPEAFVEAVVAFVRAPPGSE